MIDRIILGKTRNISNDRQICDSLVNISNTSVLAKIIQIIKEYDEYSKIHEKVKDCEKIKIGNLRIFSRGNWPFTQNNADFLYKFPQDLINLQNLINNQIKTLYPDRKLVWLSDQNILEIQTNYLSKKYNFIVSVSQFLILELFEKFTFLTYEQIADFTGFPIIFIEKLFEPFFENCKENSSILIKSPGILQTEKMQISLNLNFNSEKTEIFLVQQTWKFKEISAKVEKRESQEKLDEILKIQRKLILEAAIIKIVKDCINIRSGRIPRPGRCPPPGCRGRRPSGLCADWRYRGPSG